MRAVTGDEETEYYKRVGAGQSQSRACGWLGADLHCVCGVACEEVAGQLGDLVRWYVRPVVQQPH